MANFRPKLIHSRITLCGFAHYFPFHKFRNICYLCIYSNDNILIKTNPKQH